jgi:hypothetical protein
MQAPALLQQENNPWRGIMGKGILLWLIGIPIPVIIILWLIFGH